jgi:hypothetical protein
LPVVHLPGTDMETDAPLPACERASISDITLTARLRAPALMPDHAGTPAEGQGRVQRRLRGVALPVCLPVQDPALEPLSPMRQEDAAGQAGARPASQPHAGNRPLGACCGDSGATARQQARMLDYQARARKAAETRKRRKLEAMAAAAAPGFSGDAALAGGAPMTAGMVAAGQHHGTALPIHSEPRAGPLPETGVAEASPSGEGDGHIKGPAAAADSLCVLPAQRKPAPEPCHSGCLDMVSSWHGLHSCLGCMHSESLLADATQLPVSIPEGRLPVCPRPQCQHLVRPRQCMRVAMHGGTQTLGGEGT